MSERDADALEPAKRERREAALPRDVLDALLEGCQVIDRDFRYLYVNDALCAQGRKRREELLGRTMMDCYPGIEATPMFAELRRCMRERVHHAMDNEFVFANGAKAVFELRFVPVPQGLCVFSLDVTERRDLFAAIVGDSDDAIIGMRVDGTITSWNASATRIFGWSADEARGHAASFLIPPSTLAEERKRWSRIAEGERLDHFFTVRLAKDGTPIEVSITLSPLHDATGRVVGVSKIVRDMRETRARERELVRAKENAELAWRELESFSYSVAHDLRAPLRAIDGFASALAEDHEATLDAAGRRHLQHIRESARDMSALIDDILALSRVTQHTLRREPVSLSDEAASILARLARREPHRRVVTTIAPDLVVEGDRKLLAILLENLLGNAWKFTSKKAVGHIAVGVEPSAQGPVFFVKDDGAGFDMTYAEKLFGVFSRLHSAADFEGTGVGLATAQRVASRHHGRVWGEGRPGEGATFRFTLGEGAPGTEV